MKKTANHFYRKIIRVRTDDTAGCSNFGPAVGDSGYDVMAVQQGCGAVTFLVGSGSGEAFRLRLRVKLFGGSSSGSGSGQNVPAPAAPASAPAPMLKSSYEPYLTSNTIFKNVNYQNMTSY